MTLLTADRVLETSTTTGTGTYTLNGAVAGYQSFSVIGDTNTVYYGAHDVNGNNIPNGAWEIGIGTWASGGTLARTTIIDSSSTSAINWSAGTRRIFCTETASSLSLPDIQTYTTTGSFVWTKPLAANVVMVTCIGGGGGGGGGISSNGQPAPGVNTSAVGGSGGGGGAISQCIFPASLLPTTAAVTVGAGGAGGNSTTATSPGFVGVNGGNTTFGTFLFAGGGLGGFSGSAPPSTAVGGGFGMYIGLAGGPGRSLQPVTSASYFGAGGGGGGGTSAGFGIIGGISSTGQPGGAGASSGAANAGTSGASELYLGGAGGGGGAGGRRGVASGGWNDGNGGNGGLWGGGGGGAGGGQSSGGAPAGIGGTGGQGFCMITSW